jgi:hypothetical protein
MVATELFRTNVDETAHRLTVSLNEGDGAVIRGSFIDIYTFLNSFGIDIEFNQMRIVKDSRKQRIPIANALAGIHEILHLCYMLLNPLVDLGIIRPGMRFNTIRLWIQIAVNEVTMVSEQANQFTGRAPVRLFSAGLGTRFGATFLWIRARTRTISYVAW